MIHTDHESMKGQSKLNYKHAKWSTLLKYFPMLTNISNVRTTQWLMLCQKSTISFLLGFEHVKELYRDDMNFGTIYSLVLKEKLL